MEIPPATRIHLGTQGWSYPDWIGSFYPPGAKQEHYLPFYASVFDTVELDTTFYHAPRGSIVRSWARHTPEGFRFSAKLPRAITHDAALFGVDEAVRAFVHALEPLGEKLGPLLVQLPAEFTRDERNAWALERFLADAPSTARFAVEFRHRSWHVQETWDTLRKHRAAFAWTEWRDLPRPTEVTADFLYLRWLGDRREILTYDRVVIDRTPEFNAWEEDLRRVLPEVREIYGYFNNHWAGHSPASANTMKRRLGLLPVDPAERWPQRELF
jgi:uncharacterized protein YecE (DUF72 family)